MTTRIMWSAFGVVAMVVSCSGPGRGFQSDAGDATSSPDAPLAMCHASADCDDHTPCTMDACLVGGVCSNEPFAGACAAGMTCVSGHGCTAGTCTSQAQCNDSIACTTDNCLVDGTCQHTADNNLCPPGQMCSTTAGCMASCSSAADCNDNVDCTTDTCGVDGHCVHAAVNARCSGGRMCNPTMGCVMVSSCGSDAQCDDGMFCNGMEHCSPELACVAGTPPNCATTDPCRVGSCSESMRTCIVTANPTCMAGHTGTFMINPTASMPAIGYACTCLPAYAVLCGGTDATQVYVDSIAFSQTSTTLTAIVSNTSSHGAPPNFSGPPPAADGSFTLTSVRSGAASGGCDENYTLMGRFTDATTVAGTLSVHFGPGDGCGFTDCANQSFPFSAMRSGT